MHERNTSTSHASAWRARARIGTHLIAYRADDLTSYSDNRAADMQKQLDAAAAIQE